MNGSLYLFIISFVGMVVIFTSNYFYKGKPKFLIRADEIILGWLDQLKEWLRYVNKKTLGLLLHYLLERTEKFFNRMFKKLKSRVKK